MDPNLFWFFSDESLESQETHALLTESGIPFQEFKYGVDYPDSDFIPPVVQGKYGHFEGISRIRACISLWQSDPRR